ncbi:hypothetical protein H8F06_21500 [Vibrio fluvialis]|uniref:hypothetical protein n=1 Tax=Vibrio fluvialis TaxID=676 RepID=UPI00192B9B49|nr:hypothetical protein [Vibrio fluvialis]MBL4297858.1 hypothetical protein [Vibrio fluvialis]
MFDNTQGTLESVPFAIRSFYHQEVRSEATGAQVSEDYTYIDSEGQEQTGTRLVDEYQDVSYLVMNSRHDLKSWADVESAKAHGNYDAVCHFIEKAWESYHWVFHDAYLAWLEKKPVIDADMFFERIDDDSDPVFSQALYDAAVSEWEVFEPVDNLASLSDVMAEYHQELAKQNVDAWIESDIQLYAATWQVDERSRNRMEAQLGLAYRNDLDRAQTEIEWILSDNSTRTTTLAELGGVLDEYARRQSMIVNQYAVWRSGDLQQRFIATL